MQNSFMILPQEFYKKHLSDINHIHFTQREIDVIACVLNGKKTKKIAVILGIHVRTIETHIRNVMLKLECNSQESIIDFIENSDKIDLLREYYSLLKNEILFKKSLSEISKLIQNKSPYIFLTSDENKHPLITPLLLHFEMAGISLLNASRKKKADVTIVVLPTTQVSEDVILREKLKPTSQQILFLQSEKQLSISKTKSGWKVIYPTNNQNYYSVFFKLIKILFPDIDFEKIIKDFSHKYKKTSKEASDLHTPIIVDEKLSLSILSFLKKYLWLFLILFGIIFIICSAWFFNSNFKNTTAFFRSDLVIPKSVVRLDRVDLIKKIDEHLKKQDGIKTLSLVGPGGAGKTTLARQYAALQKRSSIWEINAETRESLNISFEKLGYELAKSEQDKKSLRAIQEIKNSKEKEEQIIQFVKHRLKKIPNWILLFDNVETFTDIQKHFPYDSETWGLGKVILTTRDFNVGNNKYINASISIEELDSCQKLNLFMRIMTNGQLFFTKIQKKEATEFLNEIPSFPLDVSIAAYYIKSTNISYESYLKQLHQNNRDFDINQETFLKESGDYAKTRYSIIISSLETIISEDKNFVILLALISILDSQNIPRNLLIKLKNESIVNSFIYNLKKYSLLIDKSYHPSEQNFSLHRNTQETMLDYLSQQLNLRKNSQLIQTITTGLEGYIHELIEKEDLLKIRTMVSHCKSILSHKNLLTDIVQGTLESELGGLYAHLRDYEKAKDLLETGLLKLEKQENENSREYARCLSYLGASYGELGDYEKAKDLLKKSLLIYKNYFPHEHIRMAWVLVCLANAYRDTGDYIKAKDLLEESLFLHKKIIPHNYIGMVNVYKYLGNIYRLLGDNEKSIHFLNQSLLFHKKYASKNHIELASILAHLGYAHGKAHNYKKAKDLLEESFIIYKKILPENHIAVAWPLYVLGDIYRHLKNYEKAKSFLMKSLNVYKIYFPEESFEIGVILVSLGDVYSDLGEYEKAKNLMEKSLTIYKNHPRNHVKMAWVLAHLGTIYGKLTDYKKAKDLLTQSLSIYKNHLPINHPEVAWASHCLKELTMLSDNK